MLQRACCINGTKKRKMHGEIHNDSILSISISNNPNKYDRTRGNYFACE